jgi:hypothetical protein
MAAKLETRCLHQQTHCSESIRRGVRQLEVQPAPPQSGPEVQLSAGFSPSHKLEVELRVEARLHPGIGNFYASRQERLSKVLAESDVHQVQRSAVMMFHSSADSFFKRSRFRLAHTTDLAKMEECTEPFFNEMKDQVKDLVCRTQDPRLETVGDAPRYRAIEELINRNTKRHVAQPEMEFNARLAWLLKDDMVASRQSFPDWHLNSVSGIGQSLTG